MAGVKQLGVRAQRKLERPSEILEAAFEEFVAKGYVSARVEDIAARVGVTKGTVYFYFENKEKLFERTVSYVISPIFQNVSTETADLKGSHSDRLRTILTSMYAQMATNRRAREFLRLAISEGRNFPDMIDRLYTTFMSTVLGAVQNILVAGVAAGEFGQSKIVDFPEIAISPTMLFSIWMLIFNERRGLDTQAFMEAHIDILLRGIRA